MGQELSVQDVDSRVRYIFKKSLSEIFDDLSDRMYETVSYDKKLPPKLHAPVTTYETRADPLRQKLLENNRPQIWQTVAGSTWDRGQYRNSYFSREPVAL